MAAVLLNEIIEQAVKLKPDERKKLIRVLQEKESESKTDGVTGNVHPNTIWIKEHHAEYAGRHVALKDGELIAYGDTIKEADLRAKKKGAEKYMLTYLFPLDEIPFGGW